MSAFQGDARGQGARPVDAGGVEVVAHDGRVEVVLSGQVDGRLAEELDHAAVAALRPGASIEIDCRDVEFMDSTGVAFLARLASRAGDRTITLVKPPPVVVFLVDVVKIGHLLEVVDEPSG